jgi:hypothetical protein
MAATLMADVTISSSSSSTREGGSHSHQPSSVASYHRKSISVSPSSRQADHRHHAAGDDAVRAWWNVMPQLITLVRTTPETRPRDLISSSNRRY